MDGHGGVKILHFLSPTDSLSVDFSPSTHARLPHPDAHLESGIATRWSAALARTPTLFNASKFRFAGCALSHNRLTLHLGLTDYRTFQGTHSVARPLATFGARSLASPLGNTVVVETSDGCVPFLRRAGGVGEGGGTAVFPGGHPEPDEVAFADRERGGEGDAERVRGELWRGAWREVVEELFVTEGQAGRAEGMRCLGVVARVRDGKACQVFSMRVGATAELVQSQYAEGNVRQEESCEIIMVPCGEMGDVYTKGNVRGLRLMPECVGALELWLKARGMV